MLRGIRGIGKALPVEPTLRDGENPQPAARQSVHRVGRAVGSDAPREHGVRRALGKHAIARNHGHAPAAVVEREAPQLRRGQSVARRVDPHAARQDVERRFHGITARNPLSVQFDHVAGGAPGSHSRSLPECRERIGRVALHVGDRFVTITLDHGASVRHPDLDDGHFVAGQGAGLVRTDERGRSECLGRLEMAHQRVTCRHPLRADRKRECDRREESLRDECDGHTHGEQEAVGG